MIDELKLLLIEDNPGDVRLTQEMLREAGNVHFELIYADRLSAGLKDLAKGDINVILLDLSLPDSRGLETFSKVQATAPQVPIIVMTGLHDDRLAILAVQEGAQDYLVKGQFESNLLLRSIRYAIERKQAQQALENERAQLARRVEERTAALQAANIELARAARLKDEFLASMSHELRTPLNLILGLSESLASDTYGPLSQRQLKAIGTIQQSGQHLLDLINDILDVSKIEAGKLELNKTLISVDEICQSSLVFIKQMAQEKHIKISYTLEAAVEMLMADPRRLKQVLVNLLNNAVKFTPEGRQVGLEVRGEPEAGIILFSVWDTGIGIPREAMPYLFQPFMQVDSRLAREYEGTGLGLSLVARLTEMHGGGVLVESEVGRGSRFTVSLPWQITPIPAAAPQSSPVSTDQSDDLPTESLATILLVEDNPTGLIMVKDYLETKGYEVIEAHDGQMALEQVKVKEPDLILMDIQMPVMDGLEATRHIRADDRLTTVPIIALTALAMPGDRERCLEAGANEYLSKPVSLIELLKVIEAQLERASTAKNNLK